MVNYIRVYCRCKECGHEAGADRTSDTVYRTTECPECGKNAFSKKMASFPKDMEIIIVKKGKKRC